MTFIAVRGNQPIAEDEFTAYLAALLRVENVGIFLGAGASRSAGGKLVAEIWEGYLNDYATSAQFLHENKFVSPDAVNRATAKTNCPNIEELADTLEVSRLEWERANPRGRGLPKLKQAIGDLRRSVLKASLLQEKCWDEPTQIKIEPALTAHRLLLQKLVSTRQPGQPAPWIFTTNYDMAIEWSAESVALQVINGFMGLHQRIFSPQSFDLGFRNVLARGEARFGVYNVYLAKLHGSLTWQMMGDDVVESSSQEVWPRIRGFLAGTKGGFDSGLLVYPRAAKYLQTVGYVLGELIRRFSEFLARPQTSLILSGYSFGDDHLNRILFSALQNPTLQLIIYLPEFTGIDKADSLRRPLQNLIAMGSPRVTLIGGEAAYFEKFVAQLPDPILFDAETQKIKDLMAKDKATTGSPA